MPDHLEGHDLKTRGWPDGDTQPKAPPGQWPNELPGHPNEFATPSEAALAKDLATVGDTKFKWQHAQAAKHINACALESNGRKYTRRQLEHFGDAVLALAVREMLHEKTGLNQKLYFMYASRLTSNSNLGGNNHIAAESEIEIGRSYIISGIAAGIQAARDIVTQTKEWKHFLRACEDPAVMAAWDKPK